MIINENKLYNRLKMKFSEEISNEVLKELKEQGLPCKTNLNNMKIDIGRNMHIYFLNNSGEIPNESDVLSSDMWVARIDDIDPIRIKSIKIPKLKYDKREVMSIDVNLYPFKIKKLF